MFNWLLSKISSVTNKKSNYRRQSILQAIIKSSPSAIVVIDTESRVIEWSDRSEQLYGWDRSEVIGELLTELIIPEEYRERHLMGIERYLKTKKSNLIGNKKPIELTTLHRDGHTIPIHLLLSESESITGDIVFIGMIVDISNLHKHQTAIKHSEATSNTLNLFLMSVPSPISVFDDNQCIFRNKAFQAINNCNCVDFNCQCTKNIIDDLNLKEKINTVANFGTTITQKAQCIHQQNKYYDIDVIRAVFNNKCLVLLYFVDVSDKIDNKYGNTYIQFKERNANIIAKVKSDFLEKLGDEIEINAQTIKNCDSPDVLIQSSVENLFLIANGIDSIVKLDDNNPKSIAKPVDIIGIVDEMYVFYQRECRKKNISMELNMSLDMRDLYYMKHGDKVELIFTELLDNAVKFTNSGGSIILAVIEYDNFMRIEITDTGIGIDDKNIPSLFKPFYRIDSDNKKNLGLGLYIVQSATLLLQGNVNVRSNFGQGSVFSVNIPIET